MPIDRIETPDRDLRSLFSFFDSVADGKVKIIGEPETDDQRQNRKQKAELRARIIDFQNMGTELNQQIIALQKLYKTLGKTPARKDVAIPRWADEFMIIFMPDIIELPVCLLEFEHDKLQLSQKMEGIKNGQRDKEPVYLLYIREMMHYDILLPQEEGDWQETHRQE